MCVVCISYGTCILLSSTTGPCCLSLTIVAWTTFLKAASYSQTTTQIVSPDKKITFCAEKTLFFIKKNKLKKVCYLTLPWEMRMPLSVSKPTEGPWPVWPSRPSRSNIGIHGQKSSEMWCSSSSLFLRAMMGISCRWLYSMGTFNTPHRPSDIDSMMGIWRSASDFVLIMLMSATHYCPLMEHTDREVIFQYIKNDSLKKYFTTGERVFS